MPGTPAPKFSTMPVVRPPVGAPPPVGGVDVAPPRFRAVIGGTPAFSRGHMEHGSIHPGIRRGFKPPKLFAD